MKKLVIAEKPSVARDIGRVLKCNQTNKNYLEGKNYIVTWGLGHLVTLANPEDYNKKWKEWHSEDLPMMPQKMKLVVIPQTKGQFFAVKSCMERKDVDEIIIATDAGREGELVARWILEKAGNKKPIKRLWISSVTDKAIKEGFSNLKDGRQYDNLYRAASSRAEADWIVGINATRALTCKYNAQLSCGRVQTPTLAMIAAREDEIRKFVPKPYFGMSTKTQNVLFTWHYGKNNNTQTFSREMRDETLKKIQGKCGVIKSVQKSTKKSYPEGLYDLTKLQRDANQKFGYSAKQTLNIMQKLYEQYKVLTYPRTDSRYLTTDIVGTLEERVRAVCVGNYRTFCNQILKNKIKTNKSFVDDKKVSDHHAIIPTEITPALSTMSMEEKKIYDLVVKRFLEVLLPPYEYEETSIVIEVDGEQFHAKENVEIKKGYKIVYAVDENEAAKQFNQWTEGKKIENMVIYPTEGKTKAPGYFTENTLLQAMENPLKYMTKQDAQMAKTLKETGGLGTVATRADIIEKLFYTGLMERQGNEIHITGKAKQLLSFVPDKLKQPELTAEWEEKLSTMAKGKLQQKQFITEIREYANEITKEILQSENTFRHDNLTNKTCPVCGKKMLSISNKNGKMLVCQDRNCGHKERISKVTNARCPICHKKMELIGSGDKKRFVCVCGHKESMKAFEERRSKSGAGVSKKDIAKYMKKQEKEESSNNAMAEALAKLGL